jgi:AcrR family transcriptional regulator
MRRARSELQKGERRTQLKEAAATALVGGLPYERIKVEAIAATAGVAKGTAYIYFPSKEALFLELTLDELDGWTAELEPLLSEAPPARALAISLAARPLLVRLLGMLHAVLEHNVDLDTGRWFKHAVLLRFTRLTELLAPHVGDGRPDRFLLQLHALAVGLGGMAHPGPVMEEVLQDEELQVMRVHFAADLERALVKLLV